MSELDPNISRTDDDPATYGKHSIENAISGINRLPELSSGEPTSTDIDRGLSYLTDHIVGVSDEHEPEASAHFERILAHSHIPENLELESNMELDNKIAEAEFSVASLKKYLNPIEAIKGYGRFLKRSVKEFAIPEMAGTVSAIGVGYLAHKYGGDTSGWATAISGSVGEAAGFYPTAFGLRYRELRREKNDGVHKHTRKNAVTEAGRYTVGLVGIIESFDTPVRAGAMWGVQRAAEAIVPGANQVVGLVGGKVVADHISLGAAIPYSNWHRKRVEKREAQKAERLQAYEQ